MILESNTWNFMDTKPQSKPWEYLYTPVFQYISLGSILFWKASLEDKYKLTTDWEGKLYIGISLKWGYEKGTVQLSMLKYVQSALHLFQHEKLKISHDPPYPWTQPIYGNNNCMIS